MRQANLKSKNQTVTYDLRGNVIRAIWWRQARPEARSF